MLTRNNNVSNKNARQYFRRKKNFGIREKTRKKRSVIEDLPTAKDQLLTPPLTKEKWHRIEALTVTESDLATKSYRESLRWSGEPLKISS